MSQAEVTKYRCRLGHLSGVTVIYIEPNVGGKVLAVLYDMWKTRFLICMEAGGLGGELNGKTTS